MRIRPVRVTLVLAAVAWCGACSSWQRRDISTGIPPAFRSDHLVRVTLVGGATVELARPRVDRDSLIGQAPRHGARVAVALQDIRKMEERKLDTARSVGLGIGSALIVTAFVIVGLVVLLVKAAGGQGPSS